MIAGGWGHFTTGSQGETDDSVEIRILTDSQRIAKALYSCSLALSLSISSSSFNSQFCSSLIPPGFVNMDKLYLVLITYVVVKDSDLVLI